jgi:dTDP-4-amino-4,6-dideoxygalactose transaminase
MLMTKLRENGFDATRGNSSLAIDNADNQVPPTSLQPLEAQKLMQQILFLPVSPSLPEEELMILGQLVNKSIQIRR